jgi:hypothetical protein
LTIGVTRAASATNKARSSASAIPALRITGAIISSPSSSSRLGSRPFDSHFGTAHLLLERCRRKWPRTLADLWQLQVILAMLRAATGCRGADVAGPTAPGYRQTDRPRST